MAEPGAVPQNVSADAASLPVGYRMLEYQIQSVLGSGGFGITYLARDDNLNLTVAIKEYFPSGLVARGENHAVAVREGHQSAQAKYDWGLQRFLDEARALASFRHHNIVRVLRYFKQNDSAYIVMEYELGQRLKRWVPNHAPLTRDALLSIIHPLLDGLDAVHQTGFLHRDIKPDNIYVRADGTPVLLDFGAARRVSSDSAMTNIISPGFAPFEQYHSQGKQGAWTDIYSLGAVMYWMTTGEKPTESAARVTQDTMLPASSLGDAAVFGAKLLQAIDWALLPDESRRPQSVALFRAALNEAAKPQATDMLDFHLASESRLTNRTAAARIPADQRRNLLCTILFLDLVGYAIRSVDNQVALKKVFNGLIVKALHGIAEETRIAIDTGDGAAICFLGDPEEALQSAMLLRDLLGQRYGSHVAVRMGLHMGPVRIISDINERVNVVGDGINVAKQVMDFAQANQLLVSRSYFDVISRITDSTAELFRYLGPHEDKHGRLHEVYAVEGHAPGLEPTLKVGPPGSTGYTTTVRMQTATLLAPEKVLEIESELSRHIGPLARVLVRKVLPLAQDIAHLRETLAPAIQESRTRASFLAGTPAVGQAQPGSKTAPSGFQASTGAGSLSADGLGSRPMPLSQTPSQPVLSRPNSLRSTGASQSVSQLQSVTHPFAISSDELVTIELALSKFIGPIAKVLIRKKAGHCTTFKDFIATIAQTIDRPDQREQFVQSLKRALPKRSY
ncbi:protein kinase [Rhodoferax sp.]|uniref:protein kinase domain-containing protein n=1 Tax=Rhodoferax sp. TaxID=50421 RepID=UPI0025FC41A2|nr:protein kinase [Rhodoferax sp.]